jgi:hypothetical protein
MPRPRRRGEGGIWGEDGARIKGADSQGGALRPQAADEAGQSFRSGGESGWKFSTII